MAVRALKNINALAQITQRLNLGFELRVFVDDVRHFIT